MPLYFLGFLAILAASLLLYLAAVATLATRRRPLPIMMSGDAANRLQAAGVALLWFAVGVCWLLFFNVYRIHVDMSALGNEALQAFGRGYTRRLPIVVLPYGLTCLVWTLALWTAPGRLTRRAVWAIATLCMVSILTTPFAAGALGDMQEHGFTDGAYRQLQVAHLARTVALTVAATWAIVQGWSLPKPYGEGLSR